MGLRFKLLAALYVVLILAGHDKEFALSGSVLDVFIWLGALLVLSVVALWPNTARTDRVDREIDGRSWADRIDIELAAKARQHNDH